MVERHWGSMDKRVQGSDCGVGFTPIVVEAEPARRNPLFVVELGEQSDAMADERIHGFTLLEEERKRQGEGMFATINDLKIFEQEAVLDWYANGNDFSDELRDAYIAMFDEMIRNSRTGEIGIRRIAHDPEYVEAGGYPSGPTFNAIGSSEVALECLGKMFGWLDRRGYVERRSDVYVGAFAFEWRDMPELPYEIGRDAVLPVGGSASVIKMTKQGVMVRVVAAIGESAAITRHDVPVDDWVVEFTDNGVEVQEQLSIKTSIMLQRMDDPGIKGAEMISPEDEESSPLWRIPITQECMGRRALSIDEAVRLARVMANISRREGKMYRGEFTVAAGDVSRDDDKELVVNSLLPYDPTQEALLKMGEVITGKVELVIGTLEDVERLKQLSLKQHSLIYLHPDISGPVNPRTQKIFDALVEVPQKLHVVVTAQEGWHRARQIHEQALHEVVLIPIELTGLDTEPWVMLEYGVNGEGFRVRQSKNAYKKDVAVLRRSERLMRELPVLSIQDAMRKGLFDYHTLGGKGYGLAEIIRVGCDSVPPSYILTQGLMNQWLAANRMRSRFNRLLRSGVGACDAGLLRGEFEAFYKNFWNYPDAIWPATEELDARMRVDLGLDKDEIIWVMARSNKSYEDRYPWMSFAGRFDSEGPVLLNETHFPKAVRNVLKMYFKPGISDLLLRNFSDKELLEILQDLSIPVLVQPAVRDVKYSGVLNTRKINSQGPRKMGLDLSPGMGGVVSGGDYNRIMHIEYERLANLRCEVAGKIVEIGNEVEGFDLEVVAMVESLESDNLRGLFEMVDIMGRRLGRDLDIEVAYGELGGVERWWILQQREAAQKWRKAA